MVPQRTVKVVDQPLVQILLHAHIFIIDHEMLFAAADNTAGGSCPVKQLHRFHALLPRSHAHTQPDACVRKQIPKAALEAAQQKPVVFLRPAEDIETIAFKSAADPVCLAEKAPDLFSKGLEHLIAEFSAVQFVHGVELLNIQDHGIHFGLRSFPVYTIRVLKEEVPVIKPGQCIRFHGRNQLSL